MQSYELLCDMIDVVIDISGIYGLVFKKRSIYVEIILLIFFSSSIFV